MEVPGEEGLFARQDLPAGATVTTMHGFVDDGTAEAGGGGDDDQIYHRWTSMCGESFYLALEASKVDNFKASLGHKINHSFREVNVMRRPLETARLFCFQ